MAVEMIKADAGNREATVTVDFRSAAANGSRKQILASREQVERAANSGLSLDILWPRDKHLPIATHFLQMPLLSFLAAICEQHQVTAKIHTRGTVVHEFMHVRPTAHITVTTYLNSEEAAMRWEPEEALPGRRIAAAFRIMEAGWNVQWVLGGIRLFPGWREDYEDIIDQVASAGATNLRIAFAGDPDLPFEEAPSRTGVVPVVTRSGVRFTVADRQRREAETFFSSALSRAA